MSSSDESKRPDNVIAVDFRRRVIMTESGDKPVPAGRGELVTLPFGGPPKAEGGESGAVAPTKRKARAKKSDGSADGAGAGSLATEKKAKKAKVTRKVAGTLPAAPVIPIAPPVSFLSMEKLGRFQTFIKDHLTAVTFDTRVAGVEVPRQFRGVPRLILNFSHNFHIPDFAYDEQGVRATLSFDTGDFFVQIPWDAMYAMMVPKTKEAAMWDVSVPAELTALIPALRRSLFPNGPV